MSIISVYRTTVNFKERFSFGVTTTKNTWYIKTRGMSNQEEQDFSSLRQQLDHIIIKWMGWVRVESLNGSLVGSNHFLCLYAALRKYLRCVHARVVSFTRASVQNCENWNMYFYALLLKNKKEEEFFLLKNQRRIYQKNWVEKKIKKICIKIWFAKLFPVEKTLIYSIT